MSVSIQWTTTVQSSNHIHPVYLRAEVPSKMHSFTRIFAVLSPALALALALAIPVESTVVGTHPLHSLQSATAPSRVITKDAVALTRSLKKKPHKHRSGHSKSKAKRIPTPKTPKHRKGPLRGPRLKSQTSPCITYKEPILCLPLDYGLWSWETSVGARSSPHAAPRLLVLSLLPPLLLSRFASIAVLGLACSYLLCFSFVTSF